MSLGPLMAKAVSPQGGLLPSYRVYRTLSRARRSGRGRGHPVSSGTSGPSGERWADALTKAQVAGDGPSARVVPTGMLRMPDEPTRWTHGCDEALRTV